MGLGLAITYTRQAGLWARCEPGLSMNTYCDARSSRPAGLFSFALLDVPHGYACVALTCEKPPAGFGLVRLATAFLYNPGFEAFCRGAARRDRSRGPGGPAGVEFALCVFHLGGAPACRVAGPAADVPRGPERRADFPPRVGVGAAPDQALDRSLRRRQPAGCVGAVGVWLIFFRENVPDPVLGSKMLANGRVSGRCAAWNVADFLSELMLRKPQFVGVLQVQPEFRAGAHPFG